MLEELHTHSGYMKNGATDPNVKDGADVLGGHVSKEYYTRENVLDELRRYRYYSVGAVQSLGTDRDNRSPSCGPGRQSSRALPGHAAAAPAPLVFPGG